MRLIVTGPQEYSAKLELILQLDSVTFWRVSLYPPDQRIPPGLRRLEVLLPVEMVVELDVGIAQSKSWLSRSKVIALAVRRFIDGGGLTTLESTMGWPGQPEQPSTPR